MNEITTTTTVTNKGISELLGEVVIPTGNVDFIDFIPTKAYNSYLLFFDKTATIVISAKGSIIAGEILNPSAVGINPDAALVLAPTNPNNISLKITSSSLAEDITIKIYGLDSNYNSYFYDSSILNSINTNTNRLNDIFYAVQRGKYQFSPQTFGTLNAGQFKSSWGSLYSIYIKNNSIDTRYLCLFDSTSIPIDGDIPIMSFILPGNSISFIDSGTFGAEGMLFYNAISWAFSSTEDIVTLASGTDLSCFAGII